MWARGYVFGETKASDLNQIILDAQAGNNWNRVLETKSIVELINYTSSTIDDTVRWALDYAPMFSNYALVKEYPTPSVPTRTAFCIWDRRLLHGYRYARELNYLTEKWNISSAFEGLKAVRDSFGRAFCDCDPDTLTAKAMSYGTRWMSTSNLADSFMMFYNETGLEDALNYALQEWSDLNTYYWDIDQEYYVYATYWRTWEWSSLEVVFNYDKLYRLNGTLEYWERMYTDMQNRYLEKYWSSPQWSGTVIVHSPGSSQRRLFATWNAWLLLLTYYGDFSTVNQNKMRDMLEGVNVTQVWQGLLIPAGEVYEPSTYRFRKDSNAPITDSGTTQGILTLFLQGISPQSGAGLMIPRWCQSYGAQAFPYYVFRFLYDTQQIVIPVYGGTTLKFLYGSYYPAYTFPEDGIYLITFSSDWNSIVDVKIGGDTLIRELDIVTPVYIITILIIICFVGFKLIKKKKTSIN